MADITVEPAANVQSATGGQVVSRSALLQNVWLGKIDPDEVLTHVISQIRKTCKALDPGANYVEMVAKSGCRLAQSVV